MASKTAEGILRGFALQDLLNLLHAVLVCRLQLKELSDHRSLFFRQSSASRLFPIPEHIVESKDGSLLGCFMKSELHRLRLLRGLVLSKGGENRKPGFSDLVKIQNAIRIKPDSGWISVSLNRLKAYNFSLRARKRQAVFSMDSSVFDKFHPDSARTLRHSPPDSQSIFPGGLQPAP